MENEETINIGWTGILNYNEIEKFREETCTHSPWVKIPALPCATFVTLVKFFLTFHSLVSHL